jgi:hypothetical protein
VGLLIVLNAFGLAMDRVIGKAKAALACETATSTAFSVLYVATPRASKSPKWPRQSSGLHRG